MKNKLYFNWSTGKDSAMALYALMQDERFDVDKLITSVNGHYDRVSMHGLRRSLLELQAKHIGLPLETIELPIEPSMEEYESILTKKIEQLQSEGYADTGFGDIFLEDLKDYRVKQLEPYSIQCHFPIWKVDTVELANRFVEQGFKAVVVCIKSEFMDESFVGREYDASFIKDLPKEVDPCGENGEFHTFCYDGPIFSSPIPFERGDKTYREYTSPKAGEKGMGFWFIDLI